MHFNGGRIKSIETDTQIIENQEMYFGSRGANPEAICSAISQGALILGATETCIKESDGWWSISGNVDWLIAPSFCKADEQTIFKLLVPFQEAGVNWHRSEIMASIFSEACFTCKGGALSLVSGELPFTEIPEKLSGIASEWARVILFKFREMA